MVTKQTEGSFVAIMRIHNRRLEFLLAEREDKTGFGLIGGKVELGETPEVAAIREATEESGLLVQIKGQVCPSMEGYKNDNTNTIHFFAVEVTEGVLQKTDESLSFVWAGIEDLGRLQLSPFHYQYPDCPLGVVYELAKRALLQKDPALSNVSDPDNLASTLK